MYFNCVISLALIIKAFEVCRLVGSKEIVRVEKSPQLDSLDKTCLNCHVNSRELLPAQPLTETIINETLTSSRTKR